VTRKSTHVLLTALMAGALAIPASAHPGEHSEPGKTITVTPVRAAEEAQALLESERADLPKPALTIGMKAPELAITKWVKGDSVEQFEADRAYIVEFWATWCGPCVAAFPHVSEVQAKHADELTVIGVNIWDRKKDRQTREYTESVAEQIERVSAFVEKQGDRMGYTVAIEETDKMAEAWMKAAGQNGIPCAFVVDKAGKVAWVGHPMEIDEPLTKVLAGEWDYDAAAKAAAEELENGYWYQHLMGLLANAETAERGYRLGYALLRSPFANDPGMLNAIAWSVLTAPYIPVRDRDLATTMASVACEKTDWKDASIIDTLARGYYDKGDHAKAVELQEKAVKLAEGTPMAKDLAETLEKYRAGATP
jgi:thiol-disulfide isomerase/thioredoxin